MAETISIWALPTWAPTTDDYIVFVDNADATTKKSPISSLPSSGVGDMLTSTYDPAGIAQQVAGLTATQTFSTGVKTFLAGMFGLRNVANTFTSFFTNTNTASRTYTLKDANGTLAFTSDITGTNSGTNTGDETTWRINTLYWTSNAFTAGSIELWHASDTTISRVSAGVIAVEWQTIAKVSDVTNKLETFGFAISDETTSITTWTAKLTFRMPYAFTVTSVKASLTTASSSWIPTFDINESWTTILSTKLTIDATELTSTTATTAPVISDSALASDSEITIDIDVAGTGAKGAKIYIIGHQ